LFSGVLYLSFIHLGFRLIFITKLNHQNKKIKAFEKHLRGKKKQQHESEIVIGFECLYAIQGSRVRSFAFFPEIKSLFWSLF